MVLITNGVNRFWVTKGAFSGVYSKQGYTIENDKKVIAAVQMPSPKSLDEKFLEEVEEKPLSQWSKDEVKKFAALKDIDLSGTKNINEAKALIKDFMEANAEN